MISLRPVNAKKVIPVGAIDIFLTASVPNKWLLLNTEYYLDPIKYSALFAIVGYNFGKRADGNFKLPKLNDTGDLGNFLYVCGAGENPCILSPATEPKHKHNVYIASAGSHAHSFPSDNYLRGTPAGGKLNKNGGGSSYGNAGGEGHGWHSHAASSSGSPIVLAEKNGTVWAPPAIEAFFAIYTGV